jgi:hypothetical protein
MFDGTLDSVLACAEVYISSCSATSVAQNDIFVFLLGYSGKCRDNPQCILVQSIKRWDKGLTTFIFLIRMSLGTPHDKWSLAVILATNQYLRYSQQIWINATLSTNVMTWWSYFYKPQVSLLFVRKYKLKYFRLPTKAKNCFWEQLWNAVE